MWDVREATLQTPKSVKKDKKETFQGPGVEDHDEAALLQPTKVHSKAEIYLQPLEKSKPEKGKCEESSPWRGRSSWDNVWWTDCSLPQLSAFLGDELEKLAKKKEEMGWKVILQYLVLFLITLLWFDW